MHVSTLAWVAIKYSSYGSGKAMNHSSPFVKDSGQVLKPKFILGKDVSAAVLGNIGKVWGKT
eukprot:1139336-Pelagomonas_calceolata.AAC.2